MEAMKDARGEFTFSLMILIAFMVLGSFLVAALRESTLVHLQPEAVGVEAD